MTKKYTYTVEEIETGFEVKVYDGEVEHPFLLQPFNPENSNKPFTSKEEANTWAENEIAKCIERDKNYVPGNAVTSILTPQEAAQAKADSERIERIEQALADILKKLN